MTSQIFSFSEQNHAHSFWTDDSFSAQKECQCGVCRYIRCDDGDEEFEQNFPGLDHQKFDNRMMDIGLEYQC